MSAYTKGPWAMKMIEDRYSDYPNVKLRPGSVVDASGQQLVVAGIASSTHNEESTANAHLIAAAPELLEALKSCWDLGIDINLIPLVRDVIDKAEGR